MLKNSNHLLFLTNCILSYVQTTLGTFQVKFVVFVHH